MTRRLLPLCLAASIAACAVGTTSHPEGDTSPTNPTKRDASATPADADADAVADADADAVADADADAAADARAEADAIADADAAPAFSPPTLDGTVSPGEYGATNTLSSWSMTWDDTNLYVALTNANVAEAVVLYLDTEPGTAGSNAGTTYDGTRAATLPFRADFVAYVKSTYQEHRAADGANGWAAAVTTGITLQGTGNVREMAIPWTAIRAGGRPASFGWLGYATSAGGYVYAQVPASNPSANVGLAAAFGAFYRVADATVKAPFADVGP